MELYILIGGLGLFTGFISGLVGIGGGIIMAPLLLYVPPLFGLDPLSMKVVAGLTIVQGLVACIAGSLTHSQFHMVSPRLTLYMGLTIFIAALAGGAGSHYVANDILLLLFAGLAISAVILMLIPVEKEDESPEIKNLAFKGSRAIITAGGIGLLGGLVGQGGSFILIPLMTSFVRIPTRIAIGSNLAIVLLSSAAGFIGKAATGQIAWALAIPIALTVVPATHIGSRISRRVPIRILRRILAILIAIAAAKILISLLF